MSLTGRPEERTIHEVLRGMQRGEMGVQDDLSTISLAQALVKNASSRVP